MAHIKKLNFLKNHKDLVDENYGMVAVPTFSDKMDKDLEELFKSQNKTGKVGDPSTSAMDGSTEEEQF